MYNTIILKWADDLNHHLNIRQILKWADDLNHHLNIRQILKWADDLNHHLNIRQILKWADDLNHHLNIRQILKWADDLNHHLNIKQYTRHNIETIVNLEPIYLLIFANHYCLLTFIIYRCVIYWITVIHMWKESFIFTLVITLWTKLVCGTSSENDLLWKFG